MKSFNETLKDALAALACPTDSKEPEKGAFCGYCREVCEADGTNWCDRNKYEPIIRQLEDAHRREVEELCKCLKAALDDYFKNQCPRCMGCRSTLRCEYRGWRGVLEKYTKSEGR